MDELSGEFRIDRLAVSRHLQQPGIELRRKLSTVEQIDAMVELYDSGLSLVKVGAKLGFNATTIYNHLRACGVGLRDAHGRDR